MISRVWVIVLFIITRAAHAGDLNVVQPSQFSPDAITLNFLMQREGAGVANLLVKWGIRFSGPSSNQRIRIRNILSPVIPEPRPSPFPILRNEPVGTTSRGIPLVIDFDRSLRRAGLWLANGDLNTKVSIKVFSPLGTLLGTFERQGVAGGEDFGTFVGLETDNPAGIAKFVIDYGDSPNAEEVDALWIDYLSKPAFVRYLAQIGDGRPTNTTRLQTVIKIINVSGLPGKVTVKLFNSDGSPLPMTPIDGQLGTSFNFNIPPWGATALSTNGLSPNLVAGYGQIESNVPTDVSGIYRIVTASGSLLLEAGIGSAEARVFMVGAVDKASQDQLDTGVAVINSTQSNANIKLVLMDRAGAVIGSPVVSLPPGGHMARFVSELFAGLSDFQGSLLVTSDQPISGIFIRTKSGLPSTSVPLGSTEP